LMMPSNLLLWGGAVVLCSMASPILCFSHGASLTSCQEMIPGHIRAHPLDPKHSFITLQTSSSSYLPGQLITVTVRSSRDFMGFLLQARSVGGQRNGFAEGPGTHTLRCLFEGDTVTHSDKQLKRNLSFVWRAPDMPKGDIRFHITVVQSYFVYWTGVESAVVLTPSYQRSSFNSSRFHMAADLKSQTDTSQTSVGPTKQTSSPKKTIPNVHQTLPISLQGENSQFDSTTESFRPFSQPLSQTTRVFSQPTVTPQPVTVSSGGNDPTSEGNTKTMAPVVGFVSSNTSSSFSASNSSRSFASRRSENFTLVTSISSIHSPSRPSQNEPKTTPNHSVPASPSPISIPHHLTSAEYQTSTPPTSSSSPSASNYPTMPSSPTSISPTFSSSTPSFSVVHPNPKPYPNLRPNHDQEINPNIQNTDTKPKHPSDPADAPDKEGKYPDIVPRHSAWELGMLLGCSAGLGMVLVVGLRYVYRQACGRRTEVTLNDREREYGRGEQGLVHLQECGDLVRVRKIRENSFVLLAEYDILASTSN
uniref:Reelin domain-containing protein n=1 Tax=Poecilia mexicana TaxID=48701 RepID=A0A3B3YGI0_9TELE